MYESNHCHQLYYDPKKPHGPVAAEKVFDKIQYSFLIKTQQSRNKTFHLVEDATKTGT